MRSLWPIPGKARFRFISNHGPEPNLYASFESKQREGD